MTDYVTAEERLAIANMPMLIDFAGLECMGCGLTAKEVMDQWEVTEEEMEEGNFDNASYFQIRLLKVMEGNCPCCGDE